MKLGKRLPPLNHIWGMVGYVRHGYTLEMLVNIFGFNPCWWNGDDHLQPQVPLVRGPIASRELGPLRIKKK
eukprot:5747952-Amphidinium_carterae.1